MKILVAFLVLQIDEVASIIGPLIVSNTPFVGLTLKGVFVTFRARETIRMAAFALEAFRDARLRAEA
jgi:hypothetical protein